MMKYAVVKKYKEQYREKMIKENSINEGLMGGFTLNSSYDGPWVYIYNDEEKMQIEAEQMASDKFDVAIYTLIGVVKPGNPTIEWKV